MKSISSENGNLTPQTEGLAGRKKSEGGNNNWNDHKSMVTLWLIVLFALWVVLTTALAVAASHRKIGRLYSPRLATITPARYFWSPVAKS
jgi:hypothetical protein